MSAVKRVVAGMIAALLVPLAVSVLAWQAAAAQAADWRSARRDSSGQAPDPALTREAVIQVYAARAVRWRGAFGVHTWTAVKAQNAERYTRFEVMGFGVGNGRQAVRVHEAVADGYWFGNLPTLLRDVRGGDEVDALIERLHGAAATYPYRDEYRVWPGPNSNTFIAHLAREVPELGVELPSTAIGKDYLPGGALFGRAPSGTGVQLSLLGVLGLTLAAEEGVELNVLGLNLGVDVWPPALKLPGLGRVGVPEHLPDSAWWGVRRPGAH